MVSKNVKKDNNPMEMILAAIILTKNNPFIEILTISINKKELFLSRNSFVNTDASQFC